MKRKILALASAGLFSVAATAADLADVVQQVDRQAQVERDGAVYTVVTSAQRVTPHDAPYTEIVKALCSERAVLTNVDQVIVLNRFTFKGVAFWHFDDHDDLTGACEAIDAGMPMAAFALVE